jgi:hypothetical protein
MQQETVELEELHIEDSSAKTKKEYEKILIREENRQKNVKAQNLVKLGCFDQKEEKSVDFSKLDKITYEKPFQKIYDLYEDREGNLLYIYGKTEGEDTKPYAYDVIYVETVSDEDYKKVYKAQSFEGAGLIKGLYITTFILWIVSIVITLCIVIYYMFSGDYGFIDILTNSVSYLFFIAIITALLAITNVSYRKFIGK